MPIVSIFFQSILIRMHSSLDLQFQCAIDHRLQIYRHVLVKQIVFPPIGSLQDLAAVVDYLLLSKTVSRIGCWGRSMGAVTAIMYGSRDPSVCIVLQLLSREY